MNCGGKILPAFGVQQPYTGSGSCGCGCGSGSVAGIPGWFFLVLIGGAVIAGSK